MYSVFCYGRLERTARPQNRILKIFVCLKCYAVFERTLIKTNSRGTTFIKNIDIKVDTVSIAPAGAGTSNGMLLGEFRGTNLTIEKVYIDMNNKVTGNTANIGSYGGMIGHIITTSSVDIKLSRVVNINIQAGANAAFSTGGFIGGSGNSNVTIEESFVTGSIQGGSRGIGGMIGDINGTSLIIKDSYTAVDLKNHTGQTGSFTNAGVLLRQ